MHAAIGRSLSAGPAENKEPTLVRDDFVQAMQNFLPVAMRDITKPATEGGRAGWEDVGGLNDIRSSIEEVKSFLHCLQCNTSFCYNSYVVSSSLISVLTFRKCQKD